MTTAKTVRVERNGAVARIILDRADRHNAQTPQMWRELREVTEALAVDPEVRAAVLTGEGPSFSSGLDLDERQPGGLLHRLANSGPVEALALVEQVQTDFRSLARAPFPTVAAVQGVALGAGLQLALSCDIRIVADDAVLAVAEIGLGAVPDLGATTDLPRLIGTERALDLILTARRFSGTEAADLGVALKAVPAADLEAAALDYAGRLASAPRLALALAKQATLEPNPAHSLQLAGKAQVECVRAMFNR